jgi:hypothetical protein
VTARIHLKKGRDGPATLTLVRPDGTRTWSRLHPFSPAHDLLHYAVETTLGFGEAFFGLLASGWDIGTFGEPGAPARMPPQAMWAETIVGLLDQERGSGVAWSPDDLNAAVAAALAGHEVPACRPIAAAELAGIRERHRELSGSWLGLAPGETLELEFPTVCPPAASS